MYEESDYAHGLLIYGYDRLPYMTTTQTDVATDDAVTNQKNSNYLNMATGTLFAERNVNFRFSVKFQSTESTSAIR